MLPAALTIRLALRRDADRLAAMSRDLIERGLPWSWTPARIRHAIADPETNVVIAENGPGVAGFAVMSYGDAHAHLNLLAVQPSARRRGVGRRLVQWLEATALTAGTPLVRLEVRADNAAARAFYSALFYVEVGTLRRYYGGRIDALRLQRDLRRTAPS